MRQRRGGGERVGAWVLLLGLAVSLALGTAGGQAQTADPVNVLVVDALPQGETPELQVLRDIIANFIGKISEVRPFEERPIDEVRFLQGIPQPGERNPFAMQFDIVVVFDEAGFTTELLLNDRAKVWAATPMPIPEPTGAALEFLSIKLNGVPGNPFEQGPCLNSCTLVTANEDAWAGMYAGIFTREGYLRSR